VIRILWVSRHDPLTEQIDELTQAFRDIEIEQYVDVVYNVGQLLEVYDEGLFDEMVVVLPVEIIRQLILHGIKPLKAVMRREKISWNEVRLEHHHFERITCLEIQSEPLLG